MKSIIPLEIPKRATQCYSQGEHLMPGTEIYSLILEDAARHLVRRDFCSHCWKNRQAAPLEGSVEIKGYWKSIILKKKKSDEPSRIGRAMLLLKELLENRTGKEEEIFVLCLFLSHARQLALRHEFQEEKVDYQLYEILKKEEFITVKAYPLTQIQIREIQDSLAKQLKDSPSTTHAE